MWYWTDIQLSLIHICVRELLEMLGKEDAVNYLRIRRRIVSYYKDKNKRQGGD